MPKQTARTIMEAAFHYLLRILTSSQSIGEVRIEEIKSCTNPNKKTIWEVVLSYKNVSEVSFIQLLEKRRYKRFCVSDDDAEVLSMEMTDR